MLKALEPLIRNPYYDGYLELVKHDDILVELNASSALYENCLQAMLDQDLPLRYAPDKWSISQVLLHTIETEVIFNYRALAMAREKEVLDLPGFDENQYAAQANMQHCDKAFLMDYFQATRMSTKSLIKTLKPEHFEKSGVASGNPCQVASLFFVSSGHCRHHINVINERYLKH